MSEYREQHKLSSNLESRLGPSPNEKGRTDIVFNTVYVRDIKYIAMLIFAFRNRKKSKSGKGDAMAIAEAYRYICVRVLYINK